MLAVVEIGGNQFIVRKDDEIEVKKQDVAVGKKMSVEAMLLSDEEGKETKIGTPMIE
jgi:ribosomal protein L21